MSNRTRIARISVLINMIAQFISYLFSFISRKVILISLGVEYLGLNSTLSQVLGALSVSELGIQTAIIYKLYKPVVIGDKDKICELLSIIRFFYKIISLVIFCGTILILPCLHLIVTNVSIPWNQIYFAWIIMASSSALSYLMNYNCTIIYADQKQYIYQGINLVLNICIVVFNLLLLYFLNNYYIYLVINMIGIILGNVILVVLRMRLYPWVHFVKVKMNLVVDVAKDTMDIFFGRLSGYIFNSTDNIIISIFIGTAFVGYIGNYSTISLAVMFFIANICGPIQAIIGNMLISKDRSFLNDFIRKYTYVLFFIGSCIIVPTALLLDDFVELFYGKDYLLDNLILYLLILYIILVNLQVATGTILDADGQFKIERNFCIISSFLNIVLSIIGALTLGVEGVLLASDIGMFYLLISRVYYCFKYVVKGGEVWMYFCYLFMLFVIFLGGCFFLRIFLDMFFPFVTVYYFILKGVISVFFVIMAQYIIFGKTTEFNYLISLIKVSNFVR